MTMQHDDDDTTRTPAGDSIVGLLAQRRQEILDSELFTFPIPRWNRPTVKAVFKLLPHTELGRSIRAIDRGVTKSKTDEEAAQVDLNFNTDLLIRASVDVIITDDNGSHSMGPIGAGRVAEALGLSSDTPTRIVAQQLFIADGDLMRCARALGDWSGYRAADADEQIKGE